MRPKQSGSLRPEVCVAVSRGLLWACQSGLKQRAVKNSVASFSEPLHQFDVLDDRFDEG